MLPSIIMPDKLYVQFCSSAVDGRQEDSGQQFCHPRVDYCNSLLAEVPRYQLHRLQSVLNTYKQLD